MKTEPAGAQGTLVTAGGRSQVWVFGDALTHQIARLRGASRGAALVVAAAGAWGMGGRRRVLAGD